MAVIREPEHVRRRRAVQVEHPPYRKLITKPILAFLVVAATGNFAMGVFEVLWSLWLRNLDASMRFVGFTWIAFSVPMLLSFVGGYLAERYNRWALMFSGFAVAAFAWIYYGISHNLTMFLVVNVVEGLAFAWSYPAKQGFLRAGRSAALAGERAGAGIDFGAGGGSRRARLSRRSCTSTYRDTSSASPGGCRSSGWPSAGPSCTGSGTGSRRARPDCRAKSSKMLLKQFHSERV